MKALAILALSFAAQAGEFSATTIDLNTGRPTFTYGSVTGYGNQRQINANTINMDGDVRILNGTITRLRGVDQLNAMELEPGMMPRVTFGEFRRGILFDDD
jgi:hypothetical protein